MKRHLLIHIGMPKCGSTYLQQVLLQNRARLAQAGVSYPHDGDSHPGNGYGAHLADCARLEALFDGRDRLILSHEDLFSKGGIARPLAQAARDLDLRVDVLAFIRPFSEFVYGDYSQNMKQKFGAFLAARRAYDGLDFMAFAARRASTLDPSVRFGQWRDTFAGQGFTLRSHRDIRTTFDALYPDLALDWTVPRGAVNPSLWMSECEALARMINSPFARFAPMRGWIKMRFRAAMNAAANRQDDPGRTPTRTVALEALFKQQNADLLAKFDYDNRSPRARATSTGAGRS